MTTSNKKPQLAKSEIVEALPKACTDERAAVEFIEAQRWPNGPCCPLCGVTDVYQMKNAAGTDRNEDWRWRCRGCKRTFSARTGTIYEDSRLPLTLWCRGIWEASSSKNGCSALELKRKLQISYKSALFMAHRLRFAMATPPTNPIKLDGTIEIDETYVGGKPKGPSWRKGQKVKPRAQYSAKVPVLGMLQRGGQLRLRVVPDVTAKTLTTTILEHVDQRSAIVTDENRAYKSPNRPFLRGHFTVNHTRGEYVRGTVTTNRIESVFARIKRQLNGTYHAVSKGHLHRYVAHCEWLFNARKLNDGERVQALVRAANSKRLTYQQQIGAA